MVNFAITKNNTMTKRIRTNFILFPILALICCTQPSKSRFVTGRIVEITNNEVTIATTPSDTIRFYVSAGTVRDLVNNDSVAIKYAITKPSNATDVIVLNEKPSIDNVSRMLVGSWKSDSLQISLCEDLSAEIITEGNTQKTQWTLFDNMVMFDSKSNNASSFTLTQVSPNVLHLTHDGVTIVFERLVHRGL